MQIWLCNILLCRPQWPRGLRRRSAAARLLRSWVRIPPGAWIFVCCECCVLSGRGLCDELITRPEESYRLWCVVVCDLETSRMRRPWPAVGSQSHRKKNSLVIVAEHGRVFPQVRKCGFNRKRQRRSRERSSGRCRRLRSRYRSKITKHRKKTEGRRSNDKRKRRKRMSERRRKSRKGRKKKWVKITEKAEGRQREELRRKKCRRCRRERIIE